MNKLLAGGHETGQIRRATAMSDEDPIILADVPLVAELEAMVAAGKGWSREYEARVDEVCIALFGMTVEDTNPPGPREEQFLEPGKRRSNQVAYEAAWDRHEELMAQMYAPVAGPLGEHDRISAWFHEHDVIVTDERGFVLRCLDQIQRPLLAALGEVLPGAKLTLDGSGSRSGVSAEAWAATVANEAAEFLKRRR